ncbi:MAG: nucleotide exchange factor GrpE [Chloroflexota bacterium]|nr:nucleotide exchange factor GrpE [Chloroflexota bacterium]
MKDEKSDAKLSEQQTDAQSKADVNETKPPEQRTGVQQKGDTEGLLEELQEKIKDYEAEIEDLLDKYRRKAAAFSNYRKRQERERDLQSIRLRGEVLGELLPIADDFRRALQNLPDQAREKEWAEGILLIQRKLERLLDKYEVTPIEALGEPFDPHYHSALLQAESEEYPAGTVMEEVEKGYLVGDRVLRPALVKVSLGPKSNRDESAARDET